MNLRTRLAYKAEHVVDLKTEAIIGAEIYHANEADTATLVPSLEQAQEHLDAASDLTADIKDPRRNNLINFSVKIRNSVTVHGSGLVFS